MRIFLSLLLLGFALSVMAEPPHVEVPRRAEAPFTISSWVRKFLTIGDQPFTAYNWVRRENVGTTELGFGLATTGELNPKDPKIQTYVKEWSAYYFKSLKHGLYLGTDPVYYRGFGGENYLLWRFKMPKGLRFLDFHKSYDDREYQRIPVDLAKILVQHGCAVTKDDDFENLFRGEGFGAEQTPECAKIVFDTMRDLKIDAIKYKKGAAAFEGVKRERQDFAMVLTNTSWIQPGDVAYFYKDMKDPALRAEQIQIEKLYLKVKAEPDQMEYYRKRRPWPELDEEAAKAPDRLLGKEIVVDSK